MKTMNNILFTILVISLLSSCIDTQDITSQGNSNNINTSQDTQPIEIRSFEFSGSGTKTNTDFAINENINNGQFTMHWNIGSTKPAYRLTLYISQDDQLSSDDIEVGFIVCGMFSSACTLFDRDNQSTFWLNTNHEITGYFFQYTDSSQTTASQMLYMNPPSSVSIASLLNTIPKTVYFITQVCEQSEGKLDASDIIGCYQVISKSAEIQ